MKLNPYAPVSVKELFTKDGHKSRGRSVSVWDEDTGKPIEAGVVTKNYLLITNEQMAHVQNELIQRVFPSKENYESKLFFDGKRFLRRIVIPDKQATVRVGDVVAMTVQAMNSYDGTLRAGLSLMLTLLKCTNGMTSERGFAFYRFKHAPESENWQEELNRATSIFSDTFLDHSLNWGVRSLQELVGKAVWLEDLHKTRNSIFQGISSSTWEEIILQFCKDEEKFSGSVYDFLQAATYVQSRSDTYGLMKVHFLDRFLTHYNIN